MAGKKKQPQTGLIVKNRRARFNYEILESIEAGMVLRGSEVKSIRDGKVSLGESYAEFRGGELFLVQAHIAEYVQAHARNHDPLRPRKLLLHRRQLERLHDAVNRDGMALVPLSIYTKEHHIKLELGLGRGKKTHDKRATIKEREQKREMDRAMRERR